MKEWQEGVLFTIIALIGLALPAILWDEVTALTPAQASNVILVLWAVIMGVLAFLVMAIRAKQTWSKTAQHVDVVASETSKADAIALDLFCIVYTPDQDATPDARYLDSWCTELFRINRGRSRFLQHLKIGTAPTLPYKALGDLNDVQRQNLLQLIDRYRLQPVR